MNMRRVKHTFKLTYSIKDKNIIIQNSCFYMSSISNF